MTLLEHGNFLGKRYMKDNDPAVILIYDVNGYIAGIQAGVSNHPRPYVNNRFLFFLKSIVENFCIYYVRIGKIDYPLQISS